MIHRRNKFRLLRSLILTIITTLLALIFQFQSQEADKLKENPLSLNHFSQKNPAIAFVIPHYIQQNSLVQDFLNITINLVKNEISEPKIFKFNNPKQFDSWVYNFTSFSQPKHFNLIFGLQFNNKTTSNFLDITVLYNASLESIFPSFVNSERLIQKLRFSDPKADLKITFTALKSHISEIYISSIIPFLSSYGILNICMLFIAQEILDRESLRLKYMQSCSLSLPSYWIGCFISDYFIWILVSFIYWVIYHFFHIKAFMAYPYATLLSLIFSGPSFILLTYCIGFIFDDIDSGATNSFTFMTIPLFLTITLPEPKNKKIAWVLRQLLGIYPLTNLYNLFMKIVTKKFSTHDFHYIPISIILFTICLTLIELIYIITEQTSSKINFSRYKALFMKIRKKFLSMGAMEMAQKAKDDSIKDQFVIRTKDACKLFFSTNNHPITAVNHVSIAIEKGTTFGLLGANGAGKTTLMNLILGRTAVSDGEIDIGNSTLSYCPQFDHHLFSDLTAIENMKLYGLIFGLTNREIQEKIEYLTRALDLTMHKGKLISQMSGGTQRKVSIAIAFMADANVIILDEPTSSLDPMARHSVHKLIKDEKHKSKKSFILCTHLLQEAEDLSDVISIMLRGCVYTVGSPQALSSYFGKKWKIDLLLTDTSVDTERKINAWFAKNLPTASLEFLRNRTRIYTIKCSEISLQNLIEKVRDAKNGDNGIQYFTCSSSSLESVFLELMKISEQMKNDPSELKTL